MDGKIKLGNGMPIVLIAGNCVIEDEKTSVYTAAELMKISKSLGIRLIFKASYDKANRTSSDSFRGPGLEKGLDILFSIKKKFSLPLIVDVHCAKDVQAVASVADILQVPAFLCRQTDLILACARTGLPVNVKKGQFLAPEDTFQILKKIESCGNRKIILTERGTTFGYHDLVVDMRSIDIMKRSGYPVVFDATHSVQLPGAMGKSTGGQKEFIPVLARAAVAAGVAGIFIEVHKTPSRALSDGSNSLALKDVPGFLKMIMKIDKIIKRGGGQ
jgi:2-dehydro-3-deoxyphosphooctonate aldolase (KDO 8-P synthase)